MIRRKARFYAASYAALCVIAVLMAASVVPFLQ